METKKTPIKITGQQSRILKLLFKFRFISATLLSGILKVRTDTAYQALESLVKTGLIIKQYDNSYRIDHRPAVYYLSKSGVTAVRKLMDAKESAVHALYKDESATDSFKGQCLLVAASYINLKAKLPDDTEIFTRTEISRFSEFPKNRPDLYIRTPDGQEAMIIIAGDSQPFIIQKRLDEIITHYEDESWDGDYPVVAFVFKDGRAKNSFMFKTNKKLENMGMDDSEITILATTLDKLSESHDKVWNNAFDPLKPAGFIN